MLETSKDRPVVMVSSTALDLPEHRKQVLDACLRQSTAPVKQEHLPASGSDAESGAEALAELRRRQGDAKASQELLGDAW